MNFRNLSKMNNNNLGTIMKLKYILAITFFVVFLLGLGINTQAQGVFSNDVETTQNTTVTETQTGGGDFGLFRNDTIGGGDGDGHGEGPGGNDDPIGEGVLILSIFSGAYALLKRNLKRKHEN